ncbi:hypothetical protein, partial [Bacillus sp. S14(2024)]|uniref:hypothetical protein n=1 Tax=Bacillus sp. S14(2024) TaxID=3162884 RepID=UPI003D23E7B0
ATFEILYFERNFSFASLGLDLPLQWIEIQYIHENVDYLSITFYLFSVFLFVYKKTHVIIICICRLKREESIFSSYIINLQKRRSVDEK